MDKIVGFTGPLQGRHKEFVEQEIKEIRDRLKEVYGETLPRELDKEIDYIVTETYKCTYCHASEVLEAFGKL